MIRRDWVSKTLAGTLLGLSLAFACSAVFAHLAAGLAPPLRAQLAMWMVIPVWLTVLSCVYLFRSGKRAWLWLGLVNIAVAGVLAVARFLA
jgi:hypothetical protein